MTSFLHWFFVGDNPIRLYGFFPALVWLIPLVGGILIYFPVFEYMGLNRISGTIPLTWMLRCIPPVVWLIFFAWFIPHILHNRP
jgi:cytochrome b subunit of formate dehydrogenase